MATKTVTDDSGTEYEVDEADLREPSPETPCLKFISNNGSEALLPNDADRTIESTPNTISGDYRVASNELYNDHGQGYWYFDEVTIEE